MSAILFLHGGGGADHTRYKQLIGRFRQDGIMSYAFDHHATTLAGRRSEAETELSAFKSKNSLLESNIVIWGSSMGGHVACRLVENHPSIQAVVLQSAAAYSLEAEMIPFGPGFTAELQRQDSWAGSPAFTAIENYHGPVLNMYGEFDSVIPQGVQDRFRKRAEANGEFYVLKRSGHPQLRPVTAQELKAWEQMFTVALKFVRGLQ